MNDIYERIDALLEEKGWSRRQLAIAANIKPGTLSAAFARKTKKISSDMMQQLASALNVGVAYLMGVTDDPTPHINPMPPKEAQDTNGAETLDVLNSEQFLNWLTTIEALYRNVLVETAEDYQTGIMDIKVSSTENAKAYTLKIATTDAENSDAVRKEIMDFIVTSATKVNE